MAPRPPAAPATELESRLTAARATRKLLVPYLTAGLPSPQRFVDLVAEISEQSDAIEIGVPFSDPIMDGPVIQAASTQALAGGISIDRCLDLIRDARRYSKVPLVAMTYYNPIHRRGAEEFVDAVRQAGVVGLIVPDLPYEESGELRSVLTPRAMALVQLVAPTTPLERAAMLARGSGGFVYAVSRLGVTGEQQSLGQAALGVVVRVRPHTRLPILLGIGISTGEQAAAGARIADGVIVGSAIMRQVLAGKPEAAVALARQMRRALNAEG
ncbi:MAG: tryptophan synthase subunit alpha [Actinomycetota bacterium]